MAGEDDKSKGKAQAGAEGPRKLDRRDLLMGLSTVPALGLFGYAWNRQRQYQRARTEAAAAPPVAAGRPAGDQRRHAWRRRTGPGADGSDAAHSRAFASARCATSGRSTTSGGSSTPSSGSSTR